MKNILFLIDFFPRNLNFSINSHLNYKTKFGGVISFLNVIILGFLIYSFGEDFFLRTNPKYLQQTIYPAKYNNYTINNKNFSFAFRIEDLNALQVDRPDLIYIDFVYFNYEIKNGEWNLLEQKSLDYKKCDIEDVGIESEYEKLNLKNWYCPKLENLTVGGNWDESYVRFFRIWVYKCPEGDVNHLKNVSCGKQEELNEVSGQRLFFSTFYQKYFIDPGNYESPFNIQYTTTWNLIDLNLLKSNIYNFRLGQFTSDFGWIFKSVASLQGFSLKSIFLDIMTIDSLPENDRNMVFESEIYFTKETEFYSRSFAKLQDLAATVGGIIKIFFTISAVFISWYSEKSLLFDILKFSYKFPKTKKDTKIIDSIFMKGSQSIVRINRKNFNIKSSFTNLYKTQKFSNNSNMDDSPIPIKFIKDKELKNEIWSTKILSFVSKEQKQNMKISVKSFSKFWYHLYSVFMCSGKFKDYKKIKTLLINTLKLKIKI
jgi:hypothetical protein